MDMKVTIVQTKLFWEDRARNLKHFSDILDTIGQTDLIVLPEMFTTGFSMQPAKIAEKADGPSLDWLKKKAELKKCVITGSVAVKEQDRYYNRLYWVRPGGDFSHYDKRHLFRLAGEEKQYAPGTKKIIESIGNWKICPLVCYDLRFPVWCRNHFRAKTSTYAEAQFDVLVFVANWPAVRAHAWKSLLVARAIENQCYVVGVNRVGEDGNNYLHSGDSMVIDPYGKQVSTVREDEERNETITLDEKLLAGFRKSFPVGLDADDFILTPDKT
jgi:omega-amidase